MRLRGVRLFDGRRFVPGAVDLTVANGRVARVAPSRRGGEPQAVAMPGITDAHAHVQHLAVHVREADLAGSESPEDVVASLRTDARERSGWRLGRGLDHVRWRPRTGALLAALDRAFPSVPVRLLFSDGHSALLNTPALARLKAWRAEGRLAEVQVEPDARGGRGGHAVDGRLELSTLPLPSPGGAPFEQEELAAAARELARNGITGVHDLLTTVPAYLALRDAGVRELRVHAYFAAEYAEELVRLRREFGPELESDTLRVRGIKCFADGTLGSRGALLTRPYRGEAANQGMVVDEPRQLLHHARFCLEQGLQLAVHALGDAAVANVLDAVERALEEHGRPVDHRFRVEHAEVVRQEDLDRCRRLGVVVSMQPCHFTDDAPWLVDRLEPELRAGVSPWKRLLDRGVPVCFGSDAPFTRLSPLDGIRTAVDRLATLEPPLRQRFAPERLTLEEALACYTSVPAYTAFEEDRLGDLRPGAPADLTVLDAPLERALLTVVAGGVTWMDEEAGGLLEG